MASAQLGTSLWKALRGALQITGYGVFVLGVLSGLGAFAWQCYVWLRIAYWPSMSALTLLEWLGLAWAKAPQDWLGLHALMGFVPLGFALPIAGLLGMMALALLALDEEQRP
ncbi:MAG TPA: hypothetical protein VFC18_09215 [Burkholderiales bacterium]|nr:hypothetical protein [Burkholderiales bacterium]